MRGGERVALLGSGERPATGRYGMRARHPLAWRRRPRSAPEAPLPALPRHARLVLLSDFLAAARAGCASGFGPVRRAGRRACLMQILDPAEEELPYEGRVLFEGTEREGNALIDHVGGVRSRYDGLLAAHRESLAGIAGRQGWRFTAHRTDRTRRDWHCWRWWRMLAPRMVT